MNTLLQFIFKNKRVKTCNVYQSNFDNAAVKQCRGRNRAFGLDFVNWKLDVPTLIKLLYGKNIQS